MNLLTLDLATNLGWTFGPISGRAFEFGVKTLPSTGEDIGAFIKAYDDWLQTVIERADSIVFEQPILPTQTQISTLRKLYGLCSHTEFAATVNGIRCREVAYAKVKAFMGVKRTGKEGKRDMVLAAQRYGYDINNDNIADAIGSRLYTIAIDHPNLMREFRMDMGPLGMAAAR